MKREELSSATSVAELFKVTTARTRRRLVRREDPVDWEFLSQILSATFQASPDPWPGKPVDALVYMSLLGLRPQATLADVFQELTQRVDGDWSRLLDPTTTSAQTGLGDTELGHLRTILRFVLIRFGSLNLESVRELNDDRALQELQSLPGVDLVSACTLLLRSFGRPLLPPAHAVRRVLNRMGVLPGGYTEAETFAFLKRIPVGVPLETLLTGLTALAHELCHEDSPRCDDCPILKLCDRGRETLKRDPAPDAMTMIDLFAGAGGMSLGLTQAGFTPVLAVEVDGWACETYRVNHPEIPRDHVISGDIRKVDPEKAETLLAGTRPDIIVGGPPCQGFSLIGKRGRAKTRFSDDPRNTLYKEYLRWIAHLRPRLVVMENVPGLYSHTEGAIRQDIEDNLLELGYAVDDLVVDASRFGVPQRRQRVIFVGASMTDFGDAAGTLVKRVTTLLGEHTEPEVTLQDAIGDLPTLEAGAGDEATFTDLPSTVSPYALTMGAGRSRIVYHHVARPINLRDKLLYARLKPGETAGDAIAQGARHLMVYRNDVFDDKYRRLRYDEPAPTIMSHLAKDGHMFIHPDSTQRRSITVREAARVQSFPDNFLFLGPRTAQFTQVGNAVPPKLARAIGVAIIQALAEVGR